MADAGQLASGLGAVLGIGTVAAGAALDLSTLSNLKVSIKSWQLHGLAQDSKAQAEQVRAVTIERIGTQIGELRSDLVASLDEALRLHLAR
jgi:mRNA-degrading endonuclease toxin of MazEF toxin-antitoxin module